MIKVTLTVAQSVIERLTTTFGEKRSLKALKQYTSLLETLLADAVRLRILQKNDTDRKLGHYSISINALTEQGPRLSTAKTAPVQFKKVRLSKWLKDNGSALFTVVEEGNNIKHKVSVIKLNRKLVQEVITTDTSKIAFDVYADFSVDEWNAGKQRDIYDVVKVNRESVRNYIDWVKHKAFKVSESKRLQWQFSAETVLAIADRFDGLFPQKKLFSDFGRTYYAGTSIQNVNRTLRAAIIGTGVEYDAVTCAHALKLGAVNEELSGNKIDRNELIKKQFPFILSYVKDKKNFISSIRKDAFPQSDKSEHEKQNGLIKSALNAIGFGAGLRLQSFRSKKSRSDDIQHTSLRDVFKREPEAGQRFIRNRDVIGFHKNHADINKMYMNVLKQTYKTNSETPAFFKTESGRISSNKVSAFFFQKSETMLMNTVRAYIGDKTKRVVLANIHDALILDKKLGVDNFSDMHFLIQKEKLFEFVRFEKKQPIEPFRSADESKSSAYRQPEETADSLDREVLEAFFVSYAFNQTEPASL